MSAETLNVWLTKFTQEVTNQSGGRYPPETLYLLICGLNRYLANGKQDNSFNVLDKADRTWRYFEITLFLVFISIYKAKVFWCLSLKNLSLFSRFALFRRALDAEMKDATRCGIAQMAKKEENKLPKRRKLKCGN